VDSILTEIGDSLVYDGVVKISSFGTFSVRQKGRRIGRNPKTGKEVPIMPRRVLVFRASQVLKDRINGDLSSAPNPEED
jgi:integration host factor subunit alpha